MSQIPSQYADQSGFNYPSAAGVPTNVDRAQEAVIPTGSTTAIGSSSSTVTTTVTTATTTTTTTTAGGTGTNFGGLISPNHGKLGGEHGGAGTRNNDRQGEYVKTSGDTTSPTAQHEPP